MSEPEPHPLEETWFQAERLRSAGKWQDALGLLASFDAVAHQHGSTARARHALLRAKVLTEQSGFGGVDTWTQRSQQFGVALSEAQQTIDLALLGAIWDAYGMSLHYQYLEGQRLTEPPDELLSFERGLHYRQQASDQQGIAESLFHIGLVYGVVRQDHSQALPFFRQSYELAQNLGDAITASYAIRHIAFAQSDAGDGVQALASLKESLALREQGQFIPGMAMAHVMLAHAHADLNDHAKALEHLQSAKAIFLALNAPRKVAWIEPFITNIKQQASTNMALSPLLL